LESHNCIVARVAPAQHALRVLNVPVSSADAEAERAFNSYNKLVGLVI